MAIVQNTITGRTSGSVGNVTFSTWKGKNVMKAKPDSVANPNTDGQQQQRSGMSQTVALFRLMLTAIAIGFNKLAVGMSAYNAFVSANLTSAFNYSTPGVATLVPADIFVSKGTIAPQAITGTSGIHGDVINTNWDASTLAPGQALSDKVIVAAYNSTKNDAVALLPNKTRLDSSLAVSFPTPAAWEAADSVTVYIGFYNPITKEVSDSVNATIALT